MKKENPVLSGKRKTVTEWCKENGIAPSTYYRKLRMMREDILSSEQQIVPIKLKGPARDQNHSGRDQYSHAGEHRPGSIGGDHIIFPVPLEKDRNAPTVTRREKNFHFSSFSS